MTVKTSAADATRIDTYSKNRQRMHNAVFTIVKTFLLTVSSVFLICSGPMAGLILFHLAKYVTGGGEGCGLVSFLFSVFVGVLALCPLNEIWRKAKA